MVLTKKSNLFLFKIKDRQLLLIIILSTAYLIFKAFSTFPIFSDETIYITMAKALTQGLLPYKDFFYAHPLLQLLLLTPATFFGFGFVKFYIALIGLGCVVLTYFIAKELFSEKSGLLAFASLLTFPGFLIFGSQAMGMFEALLFLLLGTFFLLKKKIFTASILFTISFFTRYLIILIFPLILLLVWKKFPKKDFIKFAAYTILFLIAVFSLNYLLFGKQYLIDTVVYHFSSNFAEKFGIANWTDQYLVLGYFTIFLSIFAFTYGILYKNKTIILFSVYPLIYDLIILFGLRQVIYHYFVFPLPFLFITVGKMLADSKYLSLKVFLVTVLFLAFFTNLQSLTFYLTEEPNQVFYELVDYTLRNTKPEEIIFGEPRSLDYVSFVTGRKTFGNHFDTDLKFINFAGRETILNEVKSAKPKLIFANQFYTEFFADDYTIVKEWNLPGYYHLILLELKEKI